MSDPELSYDAYLRLRREAGRDKEGDSSKLQWEDMSYMQRYAIMKINKRLQDRYEQRELQSLQRGEEWGSW